MDKGDIVEIMKIRKGDLVRIVGSTEEEKYDGYLFEVLSDPYVVCGSELVKIKCHELDKYFAGGYATKFLSVVVRPPMN